MSSEFLNQIRKNLSNNTPTHKVYKSFGRLHIERKLPFLCLYRRPPHNDWGTHRLVLSEASYLVASANLPNQKDKMEDFKGLLKMISDEFGVILIIDLFASTDIREAQKDDETLMSPQFIIHTSRDSKTASTIETLKSALKKVKMNKQMANVSINTHKSYVDDALTPLLSSRQAKKIHAHILGLEVAPVYRSPNQSEVYPLALRSLRRGLSRALKRAFHEFTIKQTKRTPKNYLALGRRAFVKSVFRVDEALSHIDNSFDFLLQTTPINMEAAWNSFKKKKYCTLPKFIYRPLPFDPSLMKRNLFKIPIEKIEDPTMELLMSEKQQELDHKISLLRLIDTKNFFYASLALYGIPSDELLEVAVRIMDVIPMVETNKSPKRALSPKAFAALAQREIEAYQEMYPAMNPAVEIREDLYAGLLVSHGNLLIGKEARIPTQRAYALICHEVGTHIVTYYNGKSQPFHQLYNGLADYDELQEGLGILAEYLVGGLSHDRLRIIAARVIAANALINGADFLEIHRLLTKQFSFTERTAFLIAARICRAGGLTKDIVYLRGLLSIIDYLHKGGDLDILYIGKIGRKHIPLIKELQWRKVLSPTPLSPRFLKSQDSRSRLNSIKKTGSILEAIDHLIREAS